MGDTYARMTVHGPLGNDTVEALVDTGATFTKISSSVARKVGFKRRRQVEVVLANGEKVSRELGNLEVEIASQKDIVPVTVGEDGEPDLVGYTTLEILGFKVDPVTRKLELSPPIEYWLSTTRHRSPSRTWPVTRSPSNESRGALNPEPSSQMLQKSQRARLTPLSTAFLAPFLWSILLPCDF